MTKRKALAGEPRLRMRPRKINPIVDDLAIVPFVTPPLDQSTKPSFEIETKTNFISEFAISASETSSKVYEPQSHKKAMNDPIYDQRWREAIDDELDKLATYHT